MRPSQVRESDRGTVLLAIAREAIHVPGPFVAPAALPWLLAPGASFVTLKLDGELRGCIGSIEPRRALGEDVAENARAAAYRDPRFPPVDEAQRPRLGIEVSVLSAREPLGALNESEALDLLRPGIDGVYLQFGGASSTFLPQVWESLPDPATFLAELKRKAGLPGTFWHPELRLSRYTVEKFA
ncbi:MAG TPA: AmmeMemoRadiSam system protein A [Usitatibacter sp.]|nr:AmmeMemoRadiSam system protein A [Usitatibacter sp.]